MPLACMSKNRFLRFEYRIRSAVMHFVLLTAIVLVLMNCVASNTIAILQGERAVQSNKVDTGTPGREGSLSASAYYSMATRKPEPFVSKSILSIKYNTEIIVPDTTLRTSRSRSTMFETPQSFGGELRYDVSESFGVGTIFDYSFNTEKHDSLIFYDVHDNEGIFSFSFFIRAVKNDDMVIFGYRPELCFTTVKGDYIVFADTSTYLTLTNYEDALEYDHFKEFDLFFRQTLFIRLFPQFPLSVFGGAQYALIPAHMRYSERNLNNVTIDREHIFTVYPGFGLNIHDNLYLDLYSTFPLYHSKHDNKSPISVGLKAQFRFF